MNRLENRTPGYFEVRDGVEGSGTYLDFMCPCGCGDESCIPIYKPGEPKEWDHAWEWNGDRAKVTLAPSIRRLTGCAWHGYLEAGAWRHQDGAANAANVWRAP